MLRRKLSLNILGSAGTMDGRVSILKTVISGNKIAFVSVYAPTIFDPLFFPTLTTTPLELSEYKFVIGADMNAVVNSSIDRSSMQEVGSQKQASSALKNFLSDLGLTDIYCALNPTSKEYTFFSNRHKTYSRIDYILLSKSLYPYFPRIEILPPTISDHSAVSVQCNFDSNIKKSRRWRFSTSLLNNNDFCNEFQLKLHDFLNINDGSVDDPRILWDAIKGFIRIFPPHFLLT